MDEKQRDILRRCHVDLVRDLEPKFVLDRLYQDGILTDNDLELIQAETTARGRCQILLSLLPTRGPSAYGSFQRALRETNYSHLGHILDKIEGNETRTANVSKTYGKDIANNTSDHKAETETKKTLSICSTCRKFLKIKLVPAAKDSGFLNILRHYGCILMHNIEPKELIDQFYQQVLLSDDQCERIRVATTRRDRCEVFFEELVKGQPEHVLSVLLKSLKKKYMYIVDEITRAVENKPTVCKQRPEQIQVLRKLREIESDTNVKKLDSENAPLESLSKDMKLAKVSEEGISQEDRDNTTIHAKEILSSVSEQPDASNSGHLPGVTEKCEENKCEITRQKELVESNELKMSDLTLNSEYVNIHEKKENIKESNESLQLSKIKDPQSFVAVTVNRAGETEDAAIDEFSKSLLEEAEHKFKPRTDSSGSFDEPDGMVILTTYGHLDNKIQHSKSNAKKNDEKKGCKSKHYVSKRKSHNRNNATININVSGNGDQSEPLKADTNGLSEHKAVIDTDEINRSKDTLQIATLGSTTPNEPSKRLSFAFNHLSTLINEGSFEKFDVLSRRLQERFSTDYDMLCIVGYLKTSRDLFLTNFDSAKQNINSTMELVPKTSNPRYFTLELFTTKTRMYITQKKLEKLQSTLDDAMMILETDPVGCTGRAAGWLYINDARNQTAKLSVLNLSKPNALKVYEQLFERAKASFKRSMTNFKNDGGKDGPFGFGYALCRLVILLLRCGDNGVTMNSLTPLPEDLDAAEQYLKNLEDSEIAMAKILEMHCRLAKCDYYLRRENNVRALEHAEVAYSLASELKLLEFTEHAHNRLKFLRSRSQLKVKELNDDEVDRILFGESSETMSSQSD